MAERVRILEVIECGGPGGAGNQVAAVCNGLDPARFEVHLAYAVRPGSSPRDYEAAAHGAQAFHHVPEMTREICPLLDLTAWQKLYRLFRELKPDVVHAHSSKAGFLARAAARAAGVPRIYYSPRGYSFLQSDRRLPSRWLYRELERSVSWIGEVVAVSRSEADLARDKTGARLVRVVEDAYLGELPENPARRRREEADRPTVVCASGRMSYPRHPEAFVRLIQRVTDSRNGVRGLWIGSGELEPLVAEMRRDMNLTEKLEVTGWLPHEAALERLLAADVFVHFSRWEGLPNSVLEAMAFGLPVVASDIPGNRDLIRSEENGYLAGSETELLERTLELLDDPAKRAAMGEKGRALVRERYSRERMLRELSDLYSGPEKTIAPPESRSLSHDLQTP